MQTCSIERHQAEICQTEICPGERSPAGKSFMADRAERHPAERCAGKYASVNCASVNCASGNCAAGNCQAKKYPLGKYAAKKYQAEKCSVERCVIEHCSPTLAGLKVAGLFSCAMAGEEGLSQIRELNRMLNGRDIVVSVMTRKDGRALIYVYRRAMLKRELEKSETAEFLKPYGYGGLTVEKAVARLKNRLAKSEGFPHEIGVFLGYPLGDVKGFIENGGRNCKCMGCWKVYCNENEAVKTFEKFKKCTGIYRRLYERGRTVLQLTVAV